MNNTTDDKQASPLISGKLPVVTPHQMHCIVLDHPAVEHYPVVQGGGGCTTQWNMGMTSEGLTPTGSPTRCPAGLHCWVVQGERMT